MYLPLSFKTGIVFCHVERKVALKIVRNTCRYFQNYPLEYFRKLGYESLLPV